MSYHETIDSIVYAPDAASSERQLREFLESKPDLASSGCDEEGISILFSPVMKERRDVVSALVRAGATLDCEVKAHAASGLIPGHETSTLHVAVEQGDLEMVQLLLDAGGKPLLHVYDYCDRTPLHIAAAQANLPMVKVLINAGADARANNEKRVGYSPLDNAMSGKPNPLRIDVVRWLLGAGADPLLPTWMMVTPVDRALRMGKAGEAYLEVFRTKLGKREKEWRAFLSARGGRK